MIECPDLAALPEVIEHRRWCLHCRLADEPRWSLIWWALQRCQTIGVTFDSEHERLLIIRPLPLYHDETARTRISVAQIAQFCTDHPALVLANFPPSNRGRPILAARKVRMAKFELGRLRATPGLITAIAEAGDDLMRYVSCHARGDWGAVSKQDANANDLALVEGTRLLSAYRLKNGTAIWIITEADRSATTVLLPDEY